jgi:magnesium transporter
MKISGAIDFNAPALDYARKDFPLLEAEASVEKALGTIRREGIGERVIYFYAVDERERLVGVVPTRRLLTAVPGTLLRNIMVLRVIALPAEATVLEACEFFVLYKFLAFPIVDAERRVIGIVDTDVLMESVLESEEGGHEETRSDFFEALGFHLAQVRGASPWRAFRYRFPWLLVTVTGGTICALLAGFFETTLAHSLVIAFFLIMVLGLNESVSAQSMSVTTQALRSARVTWRWFKTAFGREIATALLLGLACGALAGAIVWSWRADLAGALVIGGSIALSLINSCLIGLSVPSLLHWFNLDPKIAAGPVVLALADILALVVYFTSAWLVLR